jgi:KDO2-lipid IV(A) lauroyltransferase
VTQRELSDRAPADPATRPPAATERRLEAPHRRGGSRPRVVERVAVVAYTATERLLGRLPPGPVAAIIGTGAQLSYRLWPVKRRWSNRNFGHVLGLPPEHPDVRRLALRAYREYGRYLTELMRLPSLPADEVRGLVAPMDSDEVIRLWHDAPGGGLILTVGHMGSNEAVAASMAIHALPLSVVADDSSFPELFEHLRREREAWSVKLIPWRNLREIFGVLRRSEVLGLLVDWGYRSDGVPVRLFNAWTALPAGPATLAAKTGARILPLSVRRGPDGRYHVTLNPPIDVASLEPAELQRATQAMADALATTIAAAPEQWYSFKPMWPSDPDEMADLERRASLMQAGQPDPGPASP